MNDADHAREDQLLATGAYGPVASTPDPPDLDQVLPFIATCRDATCILHQAPARFADYEARAHAVGQHRLRTGHRVDMTEAPRDGDHRGASERADS